MSGEALNGVELAFKRYETLTGDRTAVLRRVGTTRNAVYDVEGAWVKAPWVGAVAAMQILNAFCDGFILGREVIEPKRQKQ